MIRSISYMRLSAAKRFFEHGLQTRRFHPWECSTVRSGSVKGRLDLQRCRVRWSWSTMVWHFCRSCMCFHTRDSGTGQKLARVWQKVSHASVTMTAGEPAISIWADGYLAMRYPSIVDVHEEPDARRSSGVFFRTAESGLKCTPS